MHAVHIHWSTIFTSLQTVFQQNLLSVLTYSPNICHWFYILNWKGTPLKHLSWLDRKKFFSFLRVSCLVRLRGTGGQLLLRERNNLNVNAGRLACCKIITVLFVLAIRCRSLYTVRLFVLILSSVSVWFSHSCCGI